MKKSLLWLAVLSLFATSCAQDESPEPAQEVQGPQTRTVQIDGTSPEFSGVAISYFPKSLTVRPGDTVNFKQVFSGEPHSVTFGTLIDDAIPDARKLGPEEEPSEELGQKLEALPAMLPEGPGDANQVAVNSCYVESGALPTDGTKPCPNRTQPDFNGKQSYYNSGYLPPDTEFKMKLADDIEPKTYYYYCNLHGPMMSGNIKVAEEGSSIPSQRQVDEQAKEQLDKEFAPTKKAFEEASTGKAPFPTLAGYGSPESQTTSIVEFIPETINAKVGDKVTWVGFGFHTVSFNPPADASLPIAKAPDGTFHANEKLVAPAGGPGQPMPEGEEGEGPSGSPSPGASPSPGVTGSPSPTATASPTESPTATGSPGPTATGSPSPGASPGGPPGALPPPTEINGGRFNGTEYKSSGLFVSFPPNELFSYSLTFTRAGSYRYVCLIHPAMTGTVTVT